LKIPSYIEDQFIAGKRTGQVRFALNDSVRVTSGPHAGRTAAVISVVAIDPEAVFLLEPGDPPWGDFEVPQSNLEPLD